MKEKKIPIRKCVVTGERIYKKDLIRIVKDKEDKVFVDPTSKANGKGVYIKNDINVLSIARNKKVLERELGVNDISYIYEELENYINN